MKSNANLPQPEDEAFNPRDYLLSIPREQEQDQTTETFDIRDWFLLDPAEPETEEMLLRRQLGDAGFPEHELHATAEAGAFDFRFRVEIPADYHTEAIHDRIVAALERAGHNVVFTQIATRLDEGMTSGTFWLAADAG